MGTDKMSAIKKARARATELQETMLVLHDQDLVEDYGEAHSYTVMREGFYFPDSHGPEIQIYGVIEP